MTLGRSLSASSVPAPGGRLAGEVPGVVPPPPVGCLRTTVSLGCSAATPPGGRRGAPVAKRRKRRWSSGSSSESTRRRLRTGSLCAVYPWSNLMHSVRPSTVHFSAHPQSIPSISSSVNMRREVRGNTWLKPARKASACARTPAPSVADTMSRTYSARLAEVTASSAPPALSACSGAPGRVKSRQRSSTSHPRTCSLPPGPGPARTVASISARLAPRSGSKLRTSCRSSGRPRARR
mmetsp:Transcript_35991/g.113879  ORF Transcript_35991/g.113879 Transcript_35991/m.113879 type:complete len:236 (-) Transcript_35991:380-1087(-)